MAEWTDEKVAAKVKKEVKDALAKANTDEEIGNLKAEILDLQGKLTTLENEKKAIAGEKETLETKIKSDYVLASDVEAKVKEAVNEALAAERTYNKRLSELTEAGITLDDDGLDKLRSMLDEDYDFRKSMLEQSKAKVSDEDNSDDNSDDKPDDNSDDNSSDASKDDNSDKKDENAGNEDDNSTDASENEEKPDSKVSKSLPNGASASEKDEDKELFENLERITRKKLRGDR